MYCLVTSAHLINLFSPVLHLQLDIVTHNFDNLKSFYRTIVNLGSSSLVTHIYLFYEVYVTDVTKCKNTCRKSLL